MPDLPGGHDRALDPHPAVDQIVKARGGEREADAPRIDVRVERTAEGEVVPHTPDPADVDRFVETDDERGDVLERNARDAIALAPRTRRHSTRRRVDLDRLAPRKHADLEEHGRERDDPVTAHRAPAL